MHGNRSMPPGTFIPELAYDDVRDAAAWLCQAFGFRERLRIADHRAQLCFGDGSMVVVARPRQYTAEDPGGHRWTFSQSVADVDPADWGGTWNERPDR